MPSRQYEKQEENIKNGKCRACSKPLLTKHHCEMCAEKVRIRARNRYREKAGIPLVGPTPQTYQREAIELAFSHVTIYPCGKCGHPVIDGYVCPTCGDDDPQCSCRRST